LPVNGLFHANVGASGSWPSRWRIESLYDYPYLLNDVLFDGYFVSTKVDGATDFSLDVLRNRRFRILGQPKDGGGDNPARFLLVDGPFNVNCHDVAVWKCVLSGVRNGRGETIFPRFYTAATVDRYPSFGEKIIDRLAQTLVGLVRGRVAPFPTIGSFVNRRVSTAVADCDRAGVLQEAIDGTGLNSAVERTLIISGKNLTNFDDASASGYMEENLPTTVSQGDVLQPLSHFLCTRGDTFSVRAFGDCRDPSGRVLARARCEAIVQRVPSYLADGENAPTDSGDALSKTNEKFGRRYKIVLFRWLSAE
jgi:hypothetical protein